jgi:hypothetical protein
MKETEKKKLDEERKWVRREKALFEKSVKDKKSNFERRAQDEVEELQNKVMKRLNLKRKRKPQVILEELLLFLFQKSRKKC